MTAAVIAKLMRHRVSRRTLAAVIAGLLLPLAAHTQNDRPDEALVQKLVSDPKALAEALKHCDPAATTADRDCRAAQEAQNRQFFGADPQYTPQKVDPFPNSVPLAPSPRKP